MAKTPVTIIAWQTRFKLRAEGDKLYAEGNKLCAEGDKLRAEGNKLYTEGDITFINAVIEHYGNVVITWQADACTVDGDTYSNADCD
jgi:hypothetical protein